MHGQPTQRRCETGRLVRSCRSRGDADDQPPGSAKHDFRPDARCRDASTCLAANEDRDVRAIVITGTGRFFCAGLDLRGGDIGTGLSNSAGPANLDLRNTPPTVLHAVDKPTICALNGSAAGYGMDLALGCDIRIMADSAKLAAAFTARGVLPESGGTWILPRLLGWSKAAELIFTGRTLTAAESLEMGLVSRVVPAAEVAGAAAQMAG